MRRQSPYVDDPNLARFTPTPGRCRNADLRIKPQSSGTSHPAAAPPPRRPRRGRLDRRLHRFVNRRRLRARASRNIRTCSTRFGRRSAATSSPRSSIPEHPDGTVVKALPEKEADEAYREVIEEKSKSRRTARRRSAERFVETKKIDLKGLRRRRRGAGRSKENFQLVADLANVRRRQQPSRAGRRQRVH